MAANLFIFNFKSVIVNKLMRICLFVLLVILSDNIFGLLLKTAYKNSQNSLISEIHYSLMETHEDILIFGSSRAQHHYVSDSISKITGCSVYNCGAGGQGLLFSLIQISNTLDRYVPKRIILDVSPNILTDQNSYQKLKILDPYYSSDTLIRKYLNNLPFERLKNISKIYPYNSLLYEIVTGNFIIRTNKSHGYIPIYGQINTNSLLLADSLENSNISPYPQFDYLKEIIDLCKSNEVDLFIIISPIYKRTFSDIMLIKEVNKIAQNRNVHFLDFSNSSLVLDYKCFKDNIHLNSHGANIFSKIIANSINSDHILSN